MPDAEVVPDLGPTS